jgi:hypothetical protein
MPVIVWSVWFDFLWYVRSWFNYAKYVEKYMLDGDTDHTCTLNFVKSGGIQRKLLHVSCIFLSNSILCAAGWWFGIFFIFPYIGNNNPI